MRQIKLGADRIYFGEDAVKALAELPAVRKRAYIVMSGTIQEELGQLKVVTDVLESGDWLRWRIRYGCRKGHVGLLRESPIQVS